MEAKLSVLRGLKVRATLLLSNLPKVMKNGSKAMKLSKLILTVKMITHRRASSVEKGYPEREFPWVSVQP